MERCGIRVGLRSTPGFRFLTRPGYMFSETAESRGNVSTLRYAVILKQRRFSSEIWMLVSSVLGIQLTPVIIVGHDMQEFHPAKKQVEVSDGWVVSLKAGETTDITTDETTSHFVMLPKNGGQAAGYAI